MNYGQRPVVIHTWAAFSCCLSLLTPDLRIGRLDETMNLICIDILQIMTVHLHPWILQDVLCSDSLIGLFLEKFLEEEASWWADMVRELQLMELDRVVELFVIGALEGELAAQEGE